MDNVFDRIGITSIPGSVLSLPDLVGKPVDLPRNRPSDG
jgi:hypothetical protein